MTQLLNGPHMLISGAQNVAILAELASAITYEDLIQHHPNTRITEQAFNDFLGELIPNFVDNGLLESDTLAPTYSITTTASTL